VGVRLDWQIETERLEKRSSEDPEQKRQRRLKRLRLLLFTLGMVISVCVVGAVIWFRLYTVDEQLKRELMQTVQAETATIRVGDFTQYISIQRTAPGGTWFQEQSDRFKRYQDLKSNSSVQLLGNVVDIAIDSPRARVTLEEVVDGVTYNTIWFYWRYSDGWRHVPADLTFWGDQQNVKGNATIINYQSVDTPLAQALGARVDKWWSDGCGYLGCGEVPTLTIEIAPLENEQLRWDAVKENTLIIPSPLAQGDRAPSQLLSGSLEDGIAKAIADRVFRIATNSVQFAPTSDAGWLQQSTVEWLSATFVGRGDPVRLGFIQSLKDHYGTDGMIAVIHALQPSSDIGLLGIALRQPIEQLALDWRMFFQWRLDVEKTLLARQDNAGFQTLWDAANPDALAMMRQRMSRPQQATPQVQAVAISPGTDGIARASVQATAEGQPIIIVFRLVDGAWKRSI
jgi:hypothetical protein